MNPATHGTEGSVTAPVLYMFVSPVVVDAQVVARGAGAIIRDGGRLIRVSQECAEGYDHSVCFSGIELGEDTFRSKPYAQLLPEQLGTIGGVHTCNRVGDWEVIDGRSLKPKGTLL